jgi:hypothetical protein
MPPKVAFVLRSDMAQRLYRLITYREVSDEPLGDDGCIDSD